MSETKAMTITEFLEARITEDEKTATALLKDLQEQVQEEYAGTVDEKGPMTPARLLSAQMWAHYDGQSRRRSFAKGQQIATLANPERVLVECEAKRKVLADCEEILNCGGWEYTDAPDLASGVLEALALPYKDHPDYKQEWAH